jgi:hydrogenase expression/formation protein HypE
MENNQFNGFTCPLPITNHEQVVIGHGSGGSLTKSLITSVFYAHFSNPILDAGNDFAEIALPASHNLRIVTATDGHVVDPIFFPGGDIGRLAVAGTVNDLSMSGATPKYLTASFIIEEGFPIKSLLEIAHSMQTCAVEAGVQIVAGDTKIVEKGKADKIFISTAGVGFLADGLVINGSQAKAGDAVILSGTMGDHGIAVLAARNELGFSTTVKSDIAPLNDLIQRAIQSAPHMHVLRDPTRGGVATTLNEIAIQSQVNIMLDETKLPVKKQVQAACDILGFDPLYVANEGKVLLIAPQDEVPELLKALRNHAYGTDASVIGTVEKPEGSPLVLMKTKIGGTRIVDMLTGAMLPRIC